MLALKFRNLDLGHPTPKLGRRYATNEGTQGGSTLVGTFTASLP